jgi:hypothetical protein
MDRKAWIILSICGLLLALNFYYKPEPPQPAPITNQPEASDTNNISETTKNGNVDDTDSRTLLQVNGNWWKGLSSSDYTIVNEIWRKFLKLDN